MRELSGGVRDSGEEISNRTLTRPRECDLSSPSFSRRLSPANLHAGPPLPRRSNHVRVIPTVSTVFRQIVH